MDCIHNTLLSRISTGSRNLRPDPQATVTASNTMHYNLSGCLMVDSDAAVRTSDVSDPNCSAAAVLCLCCNMCVCGYRMGPEFDPVDTLENEVQDEMPRLVKPHSGKKDFYNRSTTAV